MKKATGTILIALLVALAGLGTIAHGRTHREMGKRDGGFPLMGAMKTFLELKLTPEQQGKLLYIIESNEQSLNELRAKLVEERRNLADLMRSGEFDESAVRNAVRKISSIREEMIVRRGRMLREMKNVLTPKQVELLEAKRRARRMRWDRMRKPWDEPDE